jgi:formate dehydrogenase subunit delta
MSTGSTENLVKMANQIGSFFETMQNREVALNDIAGHIRKYWAPTMRRALLAHIAKDGGGDLKPMVLEAINAHQTELG